MKRREFLCSSAKAAAVGALLAAGGMEIYSQSKPVNKGKKLEPPKDGLKVAFAVTSGANVIDLSGPWEVFQDVVVGTGENMVAPFQMFTVGESTDPVQMTGGLQIVPQYSFANAPQSHVVVVGAQRGGPALHEWLRKASQNTDITMSVCTGAFQLARAGLLKGQSATTHHEFWDKFAKEFPGIDLHRGIRFVDNGHIATAAGLTSGVDMALHVVERYYGRQVALTTTKYLEYSSPMWT